MVQALRKLRKLISMFVLVLEMFTSVARVDNDECEYLQGKVSKMTG